jgi:hypothetical protein
MLAISALCLAAVERWPQWAKLLYSPMRWKYRLSFVLGRGTRYALLASVGLFLPIPGPWIVVASLLALAIEVRGARRMNRTSEPGPAFSPDLGGREAVAVGEEA